MEKASLLLFTLLILIGGCKENDRSGQPVHIDKPFIQDYSIKYYCGDPGIDLKKVVSDRNGYIQILSTKGLFRLHAGQFLFPG